MPGAGGVRHGRAAQRAAYRVLAGAASPPLRQPGTAAVAERYRRAAEPAVRGAAGVAATVALFATAGVAGGRGGAAIAGAWMTLAGLYCLANFWHCRETHCVVTGPGWSLAGLLALAAAVTPGGSLSWYQMRTLAAVFIVVLAAGYGLECAVAARTGRRALGNGDTDAEDR